MASIKNITKKDTEEKLPEKIKEKPTAEKKKTPQDFEKDYALWGLGRGIDVTKPTPWLEKTSFQVRKVKFEDIIETDDGGLLKEYSDEIRCRTDLNCEVKSGVKAANTPLTIGVAAEYTRSSLTTKYVVGTRVKNRTISFRADFTDLPQSRPKDLEAAKEEMRERKDVYTKSQSKINEAAKVNEDRAAGTETVTSKEREEISTFEERLYSWLLDCLKHRGSGEPVECLDIYIHGKCVADGDKCTCVADSEKKDGCKKCVAKRELEKIEKDIDHFVHHFGVTHYVSAIELGGLEYQELTGKEYQEHAGVSSNASVTSPVHGGVEASAKMSRIKRTERFKKDRKKVGRINSEDEKVAKENEAVIGCQIQPITNLVRNPYLRQALSKYTDKYTKEQYKGKTSIILRHI